MISLVRSLIIPMIAAAAIAALAIAPNLFAGEGRPAQLTVSVVRAPDPMVAHSKAYLVYEILLTSYDSSLINLLAVRVTDPDDKRTSFQFTGDKLEEILGSVGKGGGKLTTLASGESRIVFLRPKSKPSTAFCEQNQT